MAYEWTDKQIAVMRHLLLEGWPALSHGDRSIVALMLDNKLAVAMTTAETSHSSFWENLIVLGWAESADEAVRSFLPADAKAYRFSQFGRDWFAAFYEVKELERVSIRSEDKTG